jgi:hypothetical protein
MGFHISARVQKGGRFDYAPFAPFAGSTLPFSMEHLPTFKYSNLVAPIFKSIGYDIRDSGALFSPTSIALIYCQLYEKKQLSFEGVFSKNLLDGLLHFLGICLAHQYYISID